MLKYTWSLQKPTPNPGNWGQWGISEAQCKTLVDWFLEGKDVIVLSKWVESAAQDMEDFYLELCRRHTDQFAVLTSVRFTATNIILGNTVYFMNMGRCLEELRGRRSDHVLITAYHENMDEVLCHVLPATFYNMGMSLTEKVYERKR